MIYLPHRLLMGTSAKLTRFYGTHWLFVEKALNFHVFQYFFYIFANRIFFIQIYIETFVKSHQMVKLKTKKCLSRGLVQG